MGSWPYFRLNEQSSSELNYILKLNTLLMANVFLCISQHKKNLQFCINYTEHSRT